MMSELQIFNFENNEVRTMIVNDEPFFVANDVAKTLGYANASDATNKHCKKGFMGWGSDSLGRPQQFKLIPESDVYRLVFRSKLPEAEKFENWVTSEVLPSIRKHGGYLTPEKIEEALLNPDTLIQLATTLKEERSKRLIAEQKVTAMAPKALFADAVAASHTSILVGDLAKLLSQNGIKIGGNRLFVWLRENGFLIKRKGTDYNMPTQRSAEMKLFEVKETTINNPDGSIRISRTPKVTGKGQQYFINKFLNEAELLEG
ncbi:phage antirepressor protein kilac domain [Trichococcus collinsii]|uniref:Anti-repressor protein n=2 Tax=Trichococcus collinsii TaxID=157076 RepID=A0AB37ZXH8_9LACT|nr:phage antirepressor protein kilac domain [Trichococcus collinsii]SDZ97069.1 anti-repressor protein [Trichococcus collinsii]